MSRIGIMVVIKSDAIAAMGNVLDDVLDVSELDNQDVDENNNGIPDWKEQYDDFSNTCNK